MPILARHAISLGIFFVLGMLLSYFAGQLINREIQLGKLGQEEQAAFNEGLNYVFKHAGQNESVTQDALHKVRKLADRQRAADLLLAIAQSHANLDKPADPVIPDDVNDAIGPLMARLDSDQAIGLYDGLVQIQGIDPVQTAKSLLQALKPEDDAELLRVVDLLDTRLLWSRQWAPLDLWVHWLSVLADSQAELTQFNTAKRIGELPEAADDPRVFETLQKLAASEHDTVRAAVLNATAGYAALAKDPTGYEQIIFELGEDTNLYIARRAWMIVGHLEPLSGFAVNWKQADPFVAEAMLWAAVKTNPENPMPAIDAWQSGKQALSALALHEAYPSWRPWKTEAGKQLLSALRKPIETEADLLWYWRTLPVLHDAWEDLILDDIRGVFFEALFAKLSPAKIRASRYRNVIAAMIYYGRVGYEPKKWDTPDNTLMLAWAEGLQRGPLEITQVESLTFYEQVSRMLTPFEIEHFNEDGGVIDRSIIERFSYQGEYYWEQYRSLLAAAGSDHPIYAETPPLSECPQDYISLNFWLAVNTEQARNRSKISPPVQPSKPPHIDTYASRLNNQITEHRVAAALYSAMIDAKPTLISGISANFLRKHPDLTNDALRAMSDDELAALGLRRVDALPALLEAAEAAPPSANRSVEAKLLQLALWMRGDLGDDFTPTAEAMLYDKELPTSTVLMGLLHKQRPVALDYLFGDLVTPRPDLHKLFVQERYWHVFRRFVDTSDLRLWLWGDPEAQAFQLEAMQQWYAVNRWKIQAGWWPTPAAP